MRLNWVTNCPQTLDPTHRRGLVKRSIKKMADEEPENDEEEEQKEIIDRQIRTHKALQHMERELQLPSATVMPTLLKLMKAYDGNWEFIEADNYHVLVDTIFAMQESDDEQKAPGSSSGSGRKRREKKPSMRGSSSRRGARNSKRAESDDSDEHEGAHELVRRGRGRGRGAIARTNARPVASSEVAKRKAIVVAPEEDEDCEPAWEPLLALPAPLRSVSPQCQTELPSVGGRRELQRNSAGQWVRDEIVTTTIAVSKETQTDASCFHQPEDPVPATALICYEEFPAENSKACQESMPVLKETKMPPEKKAPVIVKQEKEPVIVKQGKEPVIVKQEKEPVFLSDSEVRRQLHNQFEISSEICKKCDKPLPLRFDPSRVKVEGAHASGSGKEHEPSAIVCLNPEPLQVVVPLPLPLPAVPAVNLEREDHMEFHATDPEPLLLTFPSTIDSIPAETALVAPTGGFATLSAAGVQQGVVPCSDGPAMNTDRRSSSEMACQTDLVPTVEPASGVATVVEDPMELSSEVQVKEVQTNLITSSTTVDDQELPSGTECQNSTTEGALAALASYSSESEHSDAEVLPKLGPVLVPITVEVIKTSSCFPKEDVDQGKAGAHGTPQGILPLANVSSLAELNVQSNNAILVTTADEALASPAITQSQHEEASSEVAWNTKDTEMTTPNEGQKRSFERQTSTESSKKRKRTLIKLKDLGEEQSRINNGPENDPELDRPVPSRHSHLDISRGKEKVPISLCRDPDGTKHLPEDFFYINASVVYQSAHVGISMARIGEDDRCSGCAGNCLDNRVPCECTRLTDGEYAYTVEGCLYPHFLKQEMERKRDLTLLSYCQPGACPMERTTDEVCKGHVQRRFIKECWEKCGCTQLCGNRIVQRGVVHRLQVFWTEGGKGWGIRTLEPLRAGTFVCEYVGEILTNTEMWHRNNDVHGKAQHHFSLQLDADWCSERYLKDEEALCLDGTCFGNVARFINHRCFDTNLIEIPVEIESPDHHYYHLAFFTSKDVNENEELTWDYGLDFNDKDHQIQAFECFCGSSHCRGKLEGKPWV